MRQRPWNTLCVTLALLAAGAVTAQEDPQAVAAAERARAEEQRAAAEAERAAAEARLEEARARLEAAAREIAELTVGAMGDAGIMIRSEIDELQNPRRILLGVSLGPAAARPEAGVRILGVTPDSAADAAGIRSGDVLVSVDGLALDWADGTDPNQKLFDKLAEIEPGTRFRVEHRRDDELLTAEVEARPRTEAFEFDFDFEELHRSLPPGGQAFVGRFLPDRWADMELVELTPGLGEYFETGEGVLVVRAPTDETLGLKDGDVILDIAGRKPADPRHVVRILRSYEPGERLVMTVVRRGRKQQLEADIPD